MTTIDRREFIGGSSAALLGAALPRGAAAEPAGATWISTSQRESWRPQQGVETRCACR